MDDCHSGLSAFRCRKVSVFEEWQSVHVGLTSRLGGKNSGDIVKRHRDQPKEKGRRRGSYMKTDS